MTEQLRPSIVGRWTNTVQQRGLSRVSGNELSHEERQTILELHARLPQLDHFELLGVDRRADAAKIKEAFFERSRRFHPDRYFGRELGELRKAIDEIFHRLKEAESTLGDAAKRRAYVQEHPEARTPEQQAQDEITARRKAERSARLRRLDPLARRIQNVAELTARGRQQLERGAFAEAATSLSLAASLHGRSGALEREAADAMRRAAGERAQALLERANSAEAAGDREEALTRFVEAAKAADDSPSVRIEALTRYLDIGGDPEAARVMVSSLVATAPDRASSHVLQARLLLAAGHEKAGQAALDRALKLDPDHPYARNARRKSRWPFR